MSEYIKRFYDSINLIDNGRFDLDFRSFKKLPTGTWKYVFEKNTPWDYDLLSEFLFKIENIDYAVSISYVYNCQITANDVLNLLNAWYKDIYHLPFSKDLIKSNDNNHIIIEYSSDLEKGKYQKILNDFDDFLETISYPHIIEQETAKVAEENKVDPVKEHMEKIEKITPILEEKAKSHQNNYSNSGYTPRGNYRTCTISEIDSNSGNVEFEATIFDRDEDKVSKKGLLISTVYAYDGTDSIPLRLIEGKVLSSEKILSLKKGTKWKIRGTAQFDTYANDLVVLVHFADEMEPDELRCDNAPEKRVELHLHTKMSEMDGLGTIDDYCKLAAHMGHKAIAITDHGCVQGFPAAQKAAKTNGLKMLYGSELYMVDDKLPYIKNPTDILLSKATYVEFDLETSGLSARYDHIIEFGAVKHVNGVEVDRIDILINPQIKLSSKIIGITHITDEMLADKPTIDQVLPRIQEFIGDAILVSHNADFDYGFMDANYKKCGYGPLTNPVIDTLSLCRQLYPDLKRNRLGDLCRYLSVSYDGESAHRADYDAYVLGECWLAMLAQLTKKTPEIKHKDLGEFELTDEVLKHMRARHVTVYARNQQGLKDLYEVISLSCTTYLADLPKIPKFVLEKKRANLLIGSACANGEVFETAQTRTEDVLLNVIDFYDFIEIQPPANLSYLVNENRVDSYDTVKQYIKDIASAAEKKGKLVVATGDAHYVNPEDKILRDIFIGIKARGKTSRHPLNPFYLDDNLPPYENPDQHYRSTEEMLECFDFLGQDKAYEYVVTNTNKVADMFENVIPLRDGLSCPVIENCENLLSELCWNKCHRWYGENPPDIVQERLSTELSGIINSGYSVIYYIAHKLIKLANEAGFMVGSRGSVGSSFVATMADITEVNPLPPHYRCGKCKHTEFAHIEGITSGFDLPEKKCPVCGEPMIRDGQDIPFATFLGFHADKVPDIDLNFSGEYQAIAHESTKDLLGKDNVFKAGTIETVADKTAYGYVLGYIERHPDYKNICKAEIRRLAIGCTDVKRTTGQHPGGIVVVPKTNEVFDFTPIQYPAGEKDSSWRTTHFDFHAIHDNILKLDLLGHVDPTVMRQFRDYTDVDPLNVPMTDLEALSLFRSPEALHLKHNYLNEATGALGLPEFGTQFVRGMLKETKPRNFADLLIISGLSHGTGVWAGNADELIKDGTCTLSDVIGCRDDIMVTLSNEYGLDNSLAFKTMESVRKGKGLTDEMRAAMIEHKVPQWFIDSCLKIKYMFPKAHATAYVMMAVRVAWYKVHRPLDYYANYFTNRVEKFDLVAMEKGEEAILEALKALKEKRKTKEGLSAKEEEIEQSLSVALEMYDRGMTFGNISLEKSEALRFIADHEHNQIIPAFVAIDGLGESVAKSVVEARNDKPFVSKEDLISRTKLSKAHIDALEELGVLDKLDDTNQLNLFNFFDM